MKSYLIFLLCALIVGCQNLPKNMLIKAVEVSGIHAKLLTNPNNSNRPLVIVVPGSGNNYMPNKMLYGLVQSGYDVLSIAYVGKKGLPSNIELVPLEYLKKIILWAKDMFSDRKIVLLGISKGTEYVLTFASHFHLVDGIICYAPSAFVLPNHVTLKPDEQQKSSWTLRGKGIEFAELLPFSDKAGKVIYKKYIDAIFDAPEQYNKSLIKVENIQCNLLLLSGADDLVWPSTKMANLIQAQITKSDSNIKVEHVSYEDCGHQFVWFDENQPVSAPENQSMNLTGIKKHKFVFGGTKAATIKAMMDARIVVIDFLKTIDATN